MKKALIAVCFVTLQLFATAAEPLPPEVSGEWWNERDGFQTLSLYLLKDGEGALFTATGSAKAIANYDKKFLLLRIVADKDTYLFQHDPVANTLTSRGSSYEKWPLKKQRLNLDQFIAQHFTPEWRLSAKRLDIGSWIIHYRGEVERGKLPNDSYELRITGDVLAIDGDKVRIGAELRVAEDGSGSLNMFGVERYIQPRDAKQREQFFELSKPK